MQSEPVAPLPIRPRAAPVRFDAPIPAHWFGGIAVATHIVNGVNLLFPAGERFFVRSVRHYLDQIKQTTNGALAFQESATLQQVTRSAKADAFDFLENIYVSD